MFELGEIVKVLLTGELGMVIEKCYDEKPKNYKPGYAVGLPDLSIVKLYEFELTTRDPIGKV